MANASSILSAPVFLWDLYVEYLWRYQPGSWVEWIASCFRALAFALVAPFAILTLLDIASYVIARTLGVVDATKASTGGVGVGVGVGVASATALVPETSLSESETSSVQAKDALSAPGSRGEPNDSLSTPQYFKETVVEESDMKLSGAGAFSPFPSQPPSPSLSRRDLTAQLGSGQTQLRPMTEIKSKAEGSGGGVGGGRKRSNTTSSTASRSGESQFTIIDRESGSEGEGVQMRRRKGQQLQGDADDS